MTDGLLHVSAAIEQLKDVLTVLDLPHQTCDLVREVVVGLVLQKFVVYFAEKLAYLLKLAYVLSPLTLPA